MEAGRRLVTEIFNVARTLEIPFFQRTYVWKKENWERFLDDMLRTAATRRPYFLGSVIMKQRTVGAHQALGDVRMVVDGQQRLTTLVLFFRVLLDVHNQLETFDTTFRTFNRGSFILQHNRLDIGPFEAALEGRLTPTVRALHPHSRIVQAYDYFEAHRPELAALNPHHLLQLVYFVGIDLGWQEDEQEIYDTINSLGVSPTTAELLKNELYDRTEVQLFEQTWMKVFERDASEVAFWERPITSGRTRRQAIDLFLQAFLVCDASVGDDVRVEELLQEYKHYLAQAGVSRVAVVHQLAASAAAFRDNVNPDAVHEELDQSNAMERLCVALFGLNTTTPLPYILYVLRSVPDATERQRIFELVETYLLRRVVCQETSKNYNKLFTSFIRAGVDTAAKLAARLTQAGDPTSGLPTDEQFRQAFLNANLSNEQARVVLYLIEATIRDRARHATSLAGLSHYSLEHLMPKKWRNYWGALSEPEARARDQALRKLGNLSLLSSSLNASIRDGNWETKKNGAKKKHGLVRYAQGLDTLAPDLQLTTWNEPTIEARGKRLAEQAVKRVWPYPTIAKTES